MLDWVNLSNYSDEPSTNSDILPSKENSTAILSNFAVLVGQVVEEHLPAFKDFTCLVTQHIDHTHQKMCQWSKVVSKYSKMVYTSV